MEEDTKELGGNIVLSGFNVIHPAELVVIKKIAGSYARKFSDHLKGYESLNLHLKQVHSVEDSHKYELHGKLLFDGRSMVSEFTDKNIFIALDAVLKKLEAQAL